MGITIHFKGRLNNLASVETLVDDLKDISRTMNWEYYLMDEAWEKPCTAKLELQENRAEIIGHLPLKGISINLHPHCERLPILFDARGNLRTMIGMIMINEGELAPDRAYVSIKKQFAPPDIHISIIKLLQFLKKRYIPNLEVLDEGEYWETGDRERLFRQIRLIEEKLDILEEVFSSLDVEDLKDYSSEELTKILENILRKHLGEN